MTATAAAYTAFRRAFSDPASEQAAASFAARGAQYDRWWEWYRGSAYDWATDPNWIRYISTYQLYKFTRPVYNPAARLVDFYADHVYPGVLAVDGRRLPQGVQLAIPLADDTDQALRAAIGQWWQWGNWQSGSRLMVTYGACLGEVLVELVDDLERQKVLPKVWWPGHVADVELDMTGNLTAYAIQYDATDEQGRQYTYRKQVDKESFATFKDGQPFDYGGGAEWPNPYGFCPAVWVRHRVLGGAYGEPCFAKQIVKIDEAAALASHIGDQVHKAIANPSIITGTGGQSRLEDQAKAKADTNAPSTINRRRDDFDYLTGPADTDVKSLVGDLNLADALAGLDHFLAELERDFPELSMYDRLREMSQVTGPGAERMMGDVRNRVWGAAAEYDLQSVKLFGMAVAICGFRAGGNGWGPTLTAQQQKFRGFGLASYAADELVIEIMPRPLIPLTYEETLNAAVLKKTLGVTPSVLLAEIGYDEQQIATMAEERKAQAAEVARQFNGDQVGDGEGDQ